MTLANPLKVVVGSVMMLILQSVSCSMIAKLWMRVVNPVSAAALSAKLKQVKSNILFIRIELRGLQNNFYLQVQAFRDSNHPLYHRFD